MKVAVYCRVSTQDQTIEQQSSPLIERCLREGWEYFLFAEKITGSSVSRTELDKMLQRIRSKEFDAVMVSKLDRLGRSLAHLIQLIQEFNNRDIKFICASPDVDTKTANGRFFIQIIGAVAELEREYGIERTNSKLSYIKKELRDQGSYKTKDGSVITKLGRPSGSKDKGQRRKSGYYLRYMKK